MEVLVPATCHTSGSIVIVYPGVLQSVFAAVVFRYFVLKGLQSFSAHLYSYLRYHTEMLQKPENKILHTRVFFFSPVLNAPTQTAGFHRMQNYWMKLNIWIFWL